MVDFSHISKPPMWSFEKSIAKGDELCDEFFRTLLKSINPPLFDPVRMAALRAELCWFEPRVHKGRPRKGCRRKELAEAIKAINRDDVPPSVLNAISERLMRPAAKDRLRKPLNELKRTRMERRDSFIHSVYGELVDALIEGIKPCHPAITELAKSVEGTKKPHEDALKLTHTFLSQKLRVYPPELRRMRNIILEREKSHRLFVKAVSAKEE